MFRIRIRTHPINSVMYGRHGGPGLQANEKRAKNLLRCVVSELIAERTSTSPREEGNHDSKTEVRRIPPLLAEDGSQDRQTSKSGNVFHTGGSGTTRTRSPVFQTPLTDINEINESTGPMANGFELETERNRHANDSHPKASKRPDVRLADCAAEQGRRGRRVREIDSGCRIRERN